MRRWLIGVTLVTLVASERIARADDDRDAANAAAVQKFDEGRKALEGGDHATALAAFTASNQLLASPNSLLYMARCHQALGKVASAFTTFRLAYKHAQDRLVATGDKRYVATRDTAAREAALIEADVPKLAVMVPSDALPGVVVTLNGARLAPTTWGSAVDTDPGHVTIDATGPRLTPFHEEIDLAKAETRRVDVHLVRVPTATVMLKLVSRPLGLEVRLDGRALDPAELGGSLEVDPGTHLVEATAPGHQPFRVEQPLADGVSEAIDVRLEREAADLRSRKAGTPPWLFYATAGAALASIATGSVLAIHANDRSNDEQARSPLLRDPVERDGIRTESTVANVFFIAGAVLGAGATVLAFTTEWKRRTVGAGPRGFLLQGRF